MPRKSVVPVHRLTPVYAQTEARQKREQGSGVSVPTKALPLRLVRGIILDHVCPSFACEAWQVTSVFKAKSVAAARKSVIDALRDGWSDPQTHWSDKGAYYRFEPPRADDTKGLVTVEMVIVTQGYVYSGSPQGARGVALLSEALARTFAGVKGFMAGELRHAAHMDAWFEPLKTPESGPVVKIESCKD